MGGEVGDFVFVDGDDSWVVGDCGFGFGGPGFLSFYVSLVLSGDAGDGEAD